MHGAQPPAELFATRRAAADRLLAGGPASRGAQFFSAGAVHVRVGTVSLRGPLPPSQLRLQLVVMGSPVLVMPLSFPPEESETAEGGGLARLEVLQTAAHAPGAAAIASGMRQSPLCEARLLQVAGSGFETLGVAAFDLAPMASDLRDAALPLLRPEGAVGTITLSISNSDIGPLPARPASARPASDRPSSARLSSARPSSTRPSSARPSSARPASASLMRSSSSVRSIASSGYGFSSSMTVGSRAGGRRYADIDAEARSAERETMLDQQDQWWSEWRVRQLQRHPAWSSSFGAEAKVWSCGLEDRLKQGYVVVIAEVRCQRKGEVEQREQREQQREEQRGDGFEFLRSPPPPAEKKPRASASEKKLRHLRPAERIALQMNSKKERLWHDHQMTTRQNADKYDQYTKMATDVLEEVLGADGGQVIIVPGSKEAWDERPSGRAWDLLCQRTDRKKWQDEAKLEHVASDKSFSSARLGAFELQAVFIRGGELRSILLHSKIRSRRWPSRAKLVRMLSAFARRDLVLTYGVRCTDGSLRSARVDDARVALAVEAGEDSGDGGGGERDLPLHGGAAELPSCTVGHLTVRAHDDWEELRKTLDFERLASTSSGGRLEVEIALQPTRRAFELPVTVQSATGARKSGVQVVAKPLGRRTELLTLRSSAEAVTDAAGVARLRWKGHVERLWVGLAGHAASGDGDEGDATVDTWPEPGTQLPRKDGHDVLRGVTLTFSSAPPAPPPPKPAPPPPLTTALVFSFAVRCSNGSLQPVDVPDARVSIETAGGDGGGDSLPALRSTIQLPPNASEFELKVAGGAPTDDWERLERRVETKSLRRSISGGASLEVVLDGSHRRFDLPVEVVDTRGEPQAGVKLSTLALGRRTAACSLPTVSTEVTDAAGVAHFRWSGHAERLMVSAREGRGDGDEGGETVELWPSKIGIAPSGTALRLTSDGHSLLPAVRLRVQPKAPVVPPAPKPSPPPPPPPKPPPPQPPVQEEEEGGD